MRHACAMHDAQPLDFYAIAAPGLEDICAGELRQLGCAAAVEGGGAAWHGDIRSLYRANLMCRTASRVVVRAGSFRARTFAELERHAARLPWSRFIQHGTTVALRVTARKSRLYHTGAVAERIGGVLMGTAGARASVVDDEEHADAADDRAQLVIVRIVRDACTISIDSSGALLHQRGYRQAIAKAPLRETVAAALLRASGWHGETPLLDPFCGSGTIAIEAALCARRIAPGLASAGLEPRSFAFQDWPGFDAAAWHSIVAAARTDVLPAAGVRIVAADRHGGAISAAQANAARAGVAGDIEFVRSDVAAWSADALPAGPGHVVTNPPWGVRLGERRRLYGMYAELGALAGRLPGWSVAFLSADAGLEAAVAAPLRELLATRNGGIPVRLVALGPAS
jgi:putative N6-adenine-specific DNA methylase